MSDDWIIQFARSALVEHPHFPFGKVTLGNANIGQNYWAVDVERIPKHLPHYRALKSIIANLHVDVPAGRGAIFHGNKGTGKTSAGVICLKEIISRGGQTFMFKALGLSDVAKRRAFRVTPEGIPIWEMLLQRQVLLLDDLGAEPVKSYGEDDTRVVEEVIRARYDEGLPTYITTNMKFEALIQTYKSIDSILLDPSRYEPVAVGGKNWRKGE